MANLHDVFDDTMQRQAILLRQQQLTVEALQSELLECQAKLTSSNHQHEAKIESVLRQYKESSENELLEDIKIYKKQIEEALKEKELLASENSQLLRELQLVQRGNQFTKPKVGINTSQNIPGLSEYTEVIQVLEDETERLRNNLINSEDEKLELSKINQNDKNKISNLEEIAAEKESELSNLRSDLEDSQNHLTNLQMKFSEQNEELELVRTNISTLHNERNNLQKLLESVKDKLVEGEQRVENSMRLAEEAVLEKDAALLREKHSQDEIDRLERTIQELTKELDERAKKEISKMKDNYNEKIKNLSENVARIEMERNDRCLELERSFMEKQKLMKELENLTKEVNKIKDDRKGESFRSLERLSELERKNVKLVETKENATRMLNQLTTEYKANMEEFTQRIRDLEVNELGLKKEKENMNETLEVLMNKISLLQEENKKTKDRFSKRENFLLSNLRTACKELEDTKNNYNSNLESSHKSQSSLITQLYSTLEVLQKRVENLQNLHKSQLSELEVNNIKLKTNSEDLFNKNEILQESLQENESKLLICQEANKEYKERLLSTENELERIKSQYASLIRAAKLN